MSTRKLLNPSYQLLGWLLLLILCVGVERLLAQENSSDNGHSAPRSLNQHHREIAFTMNMGEEKTLPLPVVNQPIRIQASFTGLNYFPSAGGGPAAAVLAQQDVVFDTANNYFVAMPATGISGRTCFNPENGDGDVLAAIDISVTEPVVKLFVTPSERCGPTVNVHVTMWW